MTHTKNYANILLRTPNWLGDTMMSTPAVLALREAYPRARLTVLTKPQFEDFWRTFPGVDQVLPLDRKERYPGLWGYFRLIGEIKKKNFDLALLLSPSFSSAWLAFLADIPVRVGFSGDGRDLFLTDTVVNPRPRAQHLVFEYLQLLWKGLGKTLRREKTQLLWPKSSLRKTNLHHYFKRNKINAPKGLIALAPLATYGPAKRWPLPYWKELIQKLLENRKENLIVVGGEGEKDTLVPMIEGIRGANGFSRLHLLSGETPLGLLAALLEECRLLVTNDTGPMHVAAAVGTPTVALFGSTPPTWTRPFGEGHQVIYHHVECSPCYQRTCPIGYICLHKISVKEVYQAVQKKMESPSRVKPEMIPWGAFR